MIKFEESRKYRNDIDGLRAIAVLAVIIFHFGHLQNGFLGVDVFFVISGYLITGILYRQLIENRLSISNFYIRRTRRIIPLVSFMCLFTLALGIIVMLPDDLENLAQSIIATNLFANNILPVLTTKNYWDVVNEFKPLMHTWSLGIEEQYYLFYPFIFLFLRGSRFKWILPCLIVCTIISLVLFFSSFEHFYKFYLLPFRFFELSIGGIMAIVLKNKLVVHSFSPLLITILLIILCADLSFVSFDILLLLTVITTSAILISSNEKNKLAALFLENKVMVAIGKLSFSLYMWHQILLAFGRYFVLKELNAINLAIIFVLTFILSIFTYYFIEEPYRNKQKVKNKKLFWSLSLAFILTSFTSLYIYANAGVIRDIPELDVSTQNIERNMHSTYNDRIYDLDKDFTTNRKSKILVVGNSFARDWANILIESKLNEKIEISYMHNPESNSNFKNRVEKADYIFFTIDSPDQVKLLNISKAKLWYIGPKNFCINNGVYYNYKGPNYCNQRTKMEDGYQKLNTQLKEQLKGKYIDLIGLVIDDKGTVPVFSPNCKFISQDCRHLTKSGAKYFAELIEMHPNFILNNLSG